MTTWKEAREAKATRQGREHRLYIGAALGRPCPECKARVPAALNEAGIDYHPTCGPDARALLNSNPQASRARSTPAAT